MGNRGGEDLQQGNGWWTQQGGGLWNRAGQAAASRPYKVVSGGPCRAPHSHIDKWQGSETDHTTQGSSAGK